MKSTSTSDRLPYEYETSWNDERLQSASNGFEPSGVAAASYRSTAVSTRSMNGSVCLTTLIGGLRLVAIRPGSDEHENGGAECCEPAPVERVDECQAGHEQEVDAALVEARHEPDGQLGAEEQVARAVDQLLEAASLRGRDSEDLRLLREASRLANAARMRELGAGQVARRLAPGATERAKQREQEQ